MPGLDVHIHHPLAFFLREQIPLAGFPEGIDEDVLVLSRDDPTATALAAFVFVMVAAALLFVCAWRLAAAVFGS